MTENIIKVKSYEFAKEILNFCKNEKNTIDKNILNQIIKSGTSVGANIEEAIGAITKKDFILKVFIAYKEARETKYWLNLIKDTYQSKNVSILLDKNEELLKILGKIIKTSRENSIK